MRKVLVSALGDEKAASLIDRMALGGKRKGLEALKWMDPKAIAELVRNEHPQIIAIVLSYLDPDQSAEVLSNFNAEIRADLVMRVATLEGVQRVSYEGAQPLAMRVWIDPDRLAARNLAPGDVHDALRRNNYLAAVGQTKGNLVQVNLLANTDLRAVKEFENLTRQNLAMFEHAMRMFTPFGMPQQGGSETREKRAAAAPPPREAPPQRDDEIRELKDQLAAMRQQIADLAQKK